LTLADRDKRRACGGAIRLVLSTLLEVILSALLAPVQMLMQSGSVFQILLGRDTGWQPQRRDDGSIPLRDTVRQHRWHTLLGLFVGISAYTIATSLLIWMSPTIVGLLLAIPLSWFSGKLGAGLALKHIGLLMTPEERQPPEIARHANALQAENAKMGFDDDDSFSALFRDAALRAHHESMLPHLPHRRRGEFAAERVLAEAKIIDAETIDEALRWLGPKERMVVLHDRALLHLAMRLRPKPTVVSGQEPTADAA
jgi:membrane glycosyltransferase